MITLTPYAATITPDGSGDLDSANPSGDVVDLLFDSAFEEFSTGTLTNGDTTTDWTYINTNNAGQLAIELYPPDTAKKSVMIQYLSNEDEDVIASRKIGTSTHLFYRWNEYRSSTWDAGPTKDYRWDSLDYVVDLYMVANRVIQGSPDGSNNPVDVLSINVQGEPRDWAPDSTQSGDANVYMIDTSFTWPGGTEKVMEVEIKVNTPGQSDAIFRVWADGVLQGELVNFKFIKDGISDYTIPSFQLGMVASNQGEAFNGITKRWITDIQIAETRIG